MSFVAVVFCMQQHQQYLYNTTKLCMMFSFFCFDIILIQDLSKLRSQIQIITLLHIFMFAIHNCDRSWTILVVVMAYMKIHALQSGYYYVAKFINLAITIKHAMVKFIRIYMYFYL